MSEEKELNSEEMATDMASEETTTASAEEKEQSTESSEDTPSQEQDPIAELEAEKKELQDKYIRLYSEFENFRRRTAKESIQMRLQASKDLIFDLLPILDDFERGLPTIEKTSPEAAEGVVLVVNKFKGILEKKGLKPMEAKGQDFDLEYHEALTKMPASSPDQKGKVFDEIEKGYLLNEKVLRHAKVVIAE